MADTLENALPLFKTHEADGLELSGHNRGLLGVAPDSPDTFLLPPLMVFSPSRISTWCKCRAAAGWQYLAGYDSPPTKATERGTKMHDVLETWGAQLLLSMQSDFVQPPQLDMTTEPGQLAAEIVPLIPPEALTRSMQVETRFELVGENTWQGYKDLSAQGIVVDYKTTSDFRYAKTEDQLRTDPQAIVYAMDSLRADPELDEVRLVWLYSRTRKPFQGRRVEITLDRAYVERAFAILEAFATDMQQAADACPPPSDPIAVANYVRTLPRAYDDAEEKTDACHAYGGCPHRARCAIPMIPDPNRPRRHVHMNLADMMARLGGTTPATASPAPANPLISRLAASAAADPSPAVTAAPSAPPGPQLFTVYAAGPEAALQPGTYPVAPTPGIPQTAADVVAINPGKRGPGRPRKDGQPTAPRTIPAPPPAGMEAPAPAVAPAPAAPAPAPAAPARGVGQLYVGCFPIGVASVSFDHLLVQAQAMIGDAAYYTHFGYKTDGMMAEAIKKLVESTGIDRLVVLDPNASAANKHLSYLRSVAGTIIQAVR